MDASLNIAHVYLYLSPPLSLCVSFASEDGFISSPGSPPCLGFILPLVMVLGRMHSFTHALVA